MVYTNNLPGGQVRGPGNAQVVFAWESHVDMVRSFRPTALQYFGKLMFPAIVPNLITSWKINLSLAIRVVTIAELVGAVTGIGHQLAVAQELFSVADVFAWPLATRAVDLIRRSTSRVDRILRGERPADFQCKDQRSSRWSST